MILGTEDYEISMSVCQDCREDTPNIITCCNCLSKKWNVSQYYGNKTYFTSNEWITLNAIYQEYLGEINMCPSCEKLDKKGNCSGCNEDDYPFICWYCGEKHKITHMILHHVRYQKNRMYCFDDIKPVNNACHKKIHNKT